MRIPTHREPTHPGEILLEEFIPDEMELEYRINEIQINQADEIIQKSNNLYIVATGEVLTQHE